MRYLLSCSDNLYRQWALTCLRAVGLIQTACRTPLCSPRKVARWPATLSGHEHTCAQWKLCLESSSSQSRWLTLWPKPSAVCPPPPTNNLLCCFSGDCLSLSFVFFPELFLTFESPLVAMRQSSVRTEIALRVRSFFFFFLKSPRAFFFHLSCN